MESRGIRLWCRVVSALVVIWFLAQSYYFFTSSAGIGEGIIKTILGGIILTLLFYPTFRQALKNEFSY
ncbi:MAG: hypothetical protein WCK90_00920 [archaeon]